LRIIAVLFPFRNCKHACACIIWTRKYLCKGLYVLVHTFSFFRRKKIGPYLFKDAYPVTFVCIDHRNHVVLVNKLGLDNKNQQSSRLTVCLTCKFSSNKLCIDCWMKRCVEDQLDLVIEASVVEEAGEFN